MKFLFKLFLILITYLLILCGCDSTETGSVIFIHPDGSSAAMWGAARLLFAGPDGYLNWDKLENMGLYRSHLRNSTNSSSHGGATVHAFGIKGTYELYGINPGHPFTSASGKNASIMTEAKQEGKSIALINSGHICEPGTGVFLANAANRSMTDTISMQIINSGADILFSGGEELLLPQGVIGHFGSPGVRKDGKNLIEDAIKLGYTVIYTRDELLKLPVNTDRVLGVFAANHTFNDLSEEGLQQQILLPYDPQAPTLAEMTKVALSILHYKQKEFLLVVEEEGSDNFANTNNAAGTLEALKRADEAIGVALEYLKDHPNTLLVTAADSDAGSMAVVSIRDTVQFDQPLPSAMSNGAPLDGRGGTSTPPFVTEVDQFGNLLYFGVAWAGYDDVAGGVIAKAHGLNADQLPINIDNTEIYHLMYLTLFGFEPDGRNRSGI